MTTEQEQFVTSGEGMKLLGVDRNTFFYYVSIDRIKTNGEEKKRHRLYKLSDILSVKEYRREKREKSKERRAKTRYVIDWLRAGDLPASLALDQLVYGEEIDLGEVATYAGWRKKNQNTSIAVFDAKDRSICLGYCGLVPVPEQICLEILSGQRSETTITVEDVEAYDRLGAYTLYAISAVVHPDYPHLLYPMLYRHMRFWIEQYPERYIRKIYALAVSDQGEMLVQHLFMAPRPDLAYNAYELDMARPSASKIIRNFMGQLQQKAPLPEDLRWPPPGGSPTTATRPAFTAPAAPTAAQPAPRATTRQHRTEHASERPILPDGWVSAASFAQQHGVHQNTLKKAIQTGRFTRVQLGEWKSGRAIVKEALDETGQWAFYLQYASHPGFTRCPDCPHDEAATATTDHNDAPASEDV